MMRALGSFAAAGLDEALLWAMRLRGRGPRDPIHRLSHAERLDRLAQLREAYAPALRAAAGGPDPFFVAPPPPEAELRPAGSGPGGTACFDATWSSGVEPYLEGFRATYLAGVANRTAHARLVVGPGAGRPAVVFVHGYLGGRYDVEQRVWPVARFVARGFDAALAVLPYHAARHTGGRRPPRFPGRDPRFAIEGFRQAIADLRSLIALLRARGASEVGVVGMSLGGYTASLLATLVPDLAFVVPVVPLASLADVALAQRRLAPGEAGQREHAALEEVYRIASPFARPRQVPAERVLVVGGVEDRITPIAHAERLAAHLGAPLHRWPGGHVLQLGRSAAFAAVERLLATHGL